MQFGRGENLDLIRIIRFQQSCALASIFKYVFEIFNEIIYFKEFQKISMQLKLKLKG
jgi:hypothetical protein